MGKVQNFEVKSDKFNVNVICISANYPCKLIAKWYNHTRLVVQKAILRLDVLASVIKV